MALLKNEWAIRFVILLAGIGLGFKLFNKPEKPAQVVEQSQECKAQVIRIVKPDGTKEERIELKAGQAQKINESPAKESLKYSVTALSLGHLDIGYKFAEAKILGKSLEFEAVAAIEDVKNPQSNKSVGVRVRW